MWPRVEIHKPKILILNFHKPKKQFSIFLQFYQDLYNFDGLLYMDNKP